MARSRTGDATGHLWIEEGDRTEGVIAEVAPATRISRTYSFGVPESMEAAVSLGQRVRVPFGRKGRLIEGFVVGLDRGPWESTLRSIHSRVDNASFLTPDLLDVGREIALHYACPLGLVLKALTPEAVRRQRGLKTVRYVRLLRSPEEIQASGKRISPGRAALVSALAAAGEPVPVDRLLSDTRTSHAVLRAMVKHGWAEIAARKEGGGETPPEPSLVEPDFTLTGEQQQALAQVAAAISAHAFSVTLLFGVSGSGKTEVYVRAMRQVLAEGGQAILLVPEIVLTTQLVQRLASRFPDVAMSHSALTEAQRSLMWRDVAAGRRNVVIGTRSAVFAPCPNLGLVCVDEEQETSYKNLQAPRFNVRDVAIMRAKRLNIPVVLGSATPAVETWYNSAHRPDYRRVILRRRVRDLPMPKVHIVDMREELLERRRNVILSWMMERRLSETLERKEQALILINRRGFAQRIYCPGCNRSLTCPNCNVGLVVHSAAGMSICHYCRSRIPTPTVCPNVTCGQKLVHLGTGTQRVEDVLAERFTGARVVRVDSDTMTHRDKYQSVVRDFEDRRIDILVGTQMIAKGLDFPFVSFVGVINADPTALSSDFRGQERLFQLITQVAGRAGRADASGQVVVQTTMPELPAIRCALLHDYQSFAEAELEMRRSVGLPPFRRLARIVLAHAREEKVRREAEELCVRITHGIAALALQRADVLGPNPCMLSRLRGKYRYDLLVRAESAAALRLLLAHLSESKALGTRTESMVIDVDPVSLT